MQEGKDSEEASFLHLHPRLTRFSSGLCLHIFPNSGISVGGCCGDV